MSGTGFRKDDWVDEPTSSTVVAKVFNEILAAVHEGTLQPGQRISDAELARNFGVSRTPIREALQRLRDIGVIEASASRFTRVADVTEVQIAQAYVVWLSLYRALVEEVIPTAAPSVLTVMRTDHAKYLGHLEAFDAPQIATATFDFFSGLSTQSSNPILQRALVSVVHIIRLGSLRVPERIDFTTLGDAQVLLMEAVESQDIQLARKAMSVLARLSISEP